MAASEILLNVVFYGMALAAAAGAIAVATSKNIVRSAFALLVVLFSVAGLYAIMKADFIAAAQVLIYVGGILVLIIFAVMLTHKITDVKLSNDSTPGPAALCACLCLLFSLGVVVLSAGRWRLGPEEFSVKDKDGKVELRLTQYQLDGRTALARGGGTFEPAVVLGARAAQPLKEAPLVEFTLTVDVTTRKQGVYEKSRKVERKTVPFGGGEARAEFTGLPSGKATWEVQLRGPAGAIGAPMAAGGMPADFLIFPGVTEPVALGLAGRHLFAFEVVSVLLLAALVGAAFLARKEVKG